MNKTDYSASQLRQAATIKEQIEKLQAELHSVLGSPAPATVALAPTAAVGKSKKGTISAAGIARIKAAQKARWAKLKAAAATNPAKPAPKKKFTMSAAAKAAISRAAKARWAKIKAAKK